MSDVLMMRRCNAVLQSLTLLLMLSGCTQDSRPVPVSIRLSIDTSCSADALSLRCGATVAVFLINPDTDAVLTSHCIAVPPNETTTIADLPRMLAAENVDLG